MSLTSYRAAPPRVNFTSGPPPARGRRSAFRLAALAGPRDGYEPDELPGCSTPRQLCIWAPRLRGGVVRPFVSLRSPGLATVISLTSYRAAPPPANHRKQEARGRSPRAAYVAIAAALEKPAGALLSPHRTYRPITRAHERETRVAAERGGRGGVARRRPRRPRR